MTEIYLGNIKGDSVIIDSEMSDESTNPVQNKVVKKYIDNVESKINPTIEVYYYTVEPNDWVDSYDTELPEYNSDANEELYSYWHVCNRENWVKTADFPLGTDVGTVFIPRQYALQLSIDKSPETQEFIAMYRIPLTAQALQAEEEALHECGIVCGVGYGFNSETYVGQHIYLRCTKNITPTCTMHFKVTVIYPEGKGAV